ncbi:hypothetical protein KUTeg_021211 [Tegillarca granosa]|uniref:thioredoxin-disulfide reductase (NADPH) n=1 Tax=Tegillarca granosa TaxID=220873 RepID=A0ABQ9EA43_TEGGR|nr:hypothetical protein KUTeg_021211 [Tegillarca granosa]
MPPVSQNGGVKSLVTDQIAQSRVLVYSKTTCPFCAKVKDLFKSLKIDIVVVELNKVDNGSDIQNALFEITGQRTVPNVFINGQHLGGCDDTLKAHSEQRLMAMISSERSSYDYDLIVIGGGSGGLAAAKEAADLGKRVACFDYVQPTPIGTTWGLGGTCVNVGCIPKKLMHQAAILGHNLGDARHFGWDVPEGIKHNWEKMKNEIQAKNKKGVVIEKTAKDFILAMGERPRYPDVPGAKEYAITSDDLFSLKYCPGKTLCIGASYVSLECGGFLNGLGLDVTIMVRSILLRGFDQQMAGIIGDHMENQGIKFIRPCIPEKIVKLEDGEPGRYRVHGRYCDGTEYTDEFNTVRDLLTAEMLSHILMETLINVYYKRNMSNLKNGFVVVDEKEQTSVQNVYGIGDIIEDKPELTPVAIQAGRLLARRLCTDSTALCDYINVATTVFTPLEYGCIGYSEEDAIKKYGEENLEVYHTNFQPLEWTVPKLDENICYAKLICLIPEKEKVIGFHVLGPNAGEITQGYAVAMKVGCTKQDFDDTIGIHPTCSEIFTTLDVTKRSGKDAAQAGC